MLGPDTLPMLVLRLRAEGKIPVQFRVADIRNHLGGRFAENYIRTALANFAEDGNYVQRWSDPLFKRVSPGLYEVLDRSN